MHVLTSIKWRARKQKLGRGMLLHNVIKTQILSYSKVFFICMLVEVGLQVCGADAEVKGCNDVCYFPK